MPNWGNGARGAASGAALGSVAGPYGAVVGGVVGGGLGLLSGNDQNAAQQTAGAIQNLPWDQNRAQIQGLLAGGSPWQSGSQVGANQYGGGINSLISQLQAQSQGRGPSVGQDAYRAASQDSMAQQAALSRVGGAAGARQAGINQGRIQQGMAQGLSAARTQEQLGAMGQLGSVYNMASNQDFQRDALNAQLRAQAQQGNQSAYLNLIAQQMGITVEQARALAASGGLQIGAAGMPTTMDQIMQAGSAVGATVAGMRQGGGQPAGSGPGLYGGQYPGTGRG